MLCNVKLVLFVIILSLFTIVYNKIVTVLRSELLLHNFIIEKLQN